jgi:hypothetical protein
MPGSEQAHALLFILMYATCFRQLMSLAGVQKASGLGRAVHEIAALHVFHASWGVTYVVVPACMCYLLACAAGADATTCMSSIP